jgi:O-antigen ligase
MVALVVARPLVWGEDPGRLLGLSPADLLLGQLWLVAALGWGVWRLWSGQGTCYAGLVEAGLLAVVAALALSSGWAAAYRHPARLIVWEWVVLLVAFCLVRQLARSAAENRGLVAVCLATAVTLSLQAIYQHLRGTARPAATFADARSFAGYLVLLVPVLAGATAASGQAEGWSLRTRLCAAGVVVSGYALLLTQAWAGVAALLLTAGLLVAIRFARALATRRGLAAIAVTAAVVFLAPFLLRDTALGARALAGLRHRADYWQTTWVMMGERPWLGVGPGNFGRRFLRHMSARTPAVDDPHNFLLETWAAGGLVALGALVFTGIVFFRRVGPTWVGPDTVPPDPARLRHHHEPSAVAEGPPAAATGPEAAAAEGTQAGDVDQGKPAGTPLPRTPWEFFLGGVAGLFLGFWLAAGNLGHEQIRVEGLVAGVRALFWFALFALFEGIAWEGRARARALSLGVSAALLYLLVASGFFFPAVAQPLWLVAALALNALAGESPAVAFRHWLAFVLPVPALAVLAGVYFLLVLYPVTASSGEQRAARRAAELWADKLDADWRQKRQVKDPMDQSAIATRASLDLKRRIIDRLVRAAQSDPGAATPHVELCRWYGQQWELLSGIEGFNPKDPRHNNQELGLIPAQNAAFVNARNHARIAQRLDPEGTAGYLAEHDLHRLFARHVPRLRSQQYRLALDPLQKAVANDPRSPRLHFWLAELYRELDDRPRHLEEAREALRLDRLSVQPRRKLSAEDRLRLEQWLQ